MNSANFSQSHPYRHPVADSAARGASGSYVHPLSEHSIDWLQITMLQTVLHRQTKALQEE
jgi:hypothetical protein